MLGRIFLKFCVILPVLIVAVLAVYGQTPNTNAHNNDLQNSNPKADSIQQHLGPVQETSENKRSKIDSLEKVMDRENIIRNSNYKVDSIQSSFYQSSDSLSNTYKTNLNMLDVLQRRLENKVDSLTTLKLPTTAVTQKLDSVNKLRQNTAASLEEKIQSLKDQATEKLKKLDLPSEMNEKAALVTKNIDDIKIPTSDKLPINTASPLNASDLSGKANELKIPGGMGEVDQLKTVEQNAADFSKVTKEAGGYVKEADQLAEGNVTDVKELPNVAEEKVAKATGVDELENETALDEYKDMAGKVQDPEALKKEATEKAKQVAVNHFAGKEEQLKSAMDKMSEYKQKYSRMSGISDLSKRRPNEMQGKPLIERIIPGLAFQIQKKGDDIMVDVNSYAGYRFTGRLRLGIGWNQRVAYTTGRNSFNTKAKIFGPRTFGEFKLGKGFSPRAEVELMNTGVPPLVTTLDPTVREWVWGAFIGLKKEYKLIKNVRGTALLMVRLINPQHKSPYAEILNMRFGFEVPMKKKSKK